MIIAEFVAVVVLGYLLGSIPFGVIIARRTAHVNVLEMGSKSTGMTNVLRTAGTKAAAMVFASDLLKGVLAVVFARILMDNSYLAVGIFGFSFLGGGCFSPGMFHPPVLPGVQATNNGKGISITLFLKDSSYFFFLIFAYD